MTYSFDAFDQAGDCLEVAEERLNMAVRMFADTVDDWMRDGDVESGMDATMEVLVAARKAMSQAIAWLEQSIAYLETEARDDGAGAGGEREGQGAALPDA